MAILTFCRILTVSSFIAALRAPLDSTVNPAIEMIEKMATAISSSIREKPRSAPEALAARQFVKCAFIAGPRWCS